MSVVARARDLVRGALALDAPLLILAAIAFVSQVGIAVMLPLLPLYAITLGATPVQLGLLTSAFALANAAGQLGAGFLLDRLGARGFIRAGTAAYAGANALIATAADAVALIGFRSLAGLGAGVNLVATRLYLAQIADPARMAFVQGILSAAGSAGSVSGPAFGGIVAQLADLRLPFLLVALTSGVALAGTFALPVVQERAPEASAQAAPASALNRSVIVLLFGQLFLLAGYGAFITSYAPFATQQLGWTILEVGVVFSVFSVGSVALGPALSHLADRTGRVRIAILACLALALWGAVFVLALPRPVLYTVTVVAGGGITAFGGAWFALLAAASPAERRGRTFGIVSAVSNLGVVLGATIASAAWQAIGLPWAMLTGSVATVLAGVALLALPREGRS